MTFRSEVDQPLLRSANAGIRSTSTSLGGGNADVPSTEHLIAVRSDASLTVTNNGENLKWEGNYQKYFTTSELIIKLYAS